MVSINHIVCNVYYYRASFSHCIANHFFFMLLGGTELIEGMVESFQTEG